ncbi:hypothetical protein [Ralstonia solanacearum]|uniref:hypothetical protein n=1 Tax=Ralstonia solanacearum TaxID=305 RepID=UPI0011D25705|nr:hypothetical protein [Ralstonia solanacearum]
MNPPAAPQPYSTLMLVMGVPPILARIFGGAVLLVIWWRTFFAVRATFGVLSLAAVLFLMRDSLARPHVLPLPPARFLRDYWKLLRNRHYPAIYVFRPGVRSGHNALHHGFPVSAIALTD